MRSMKTYWRHVLVILALSAALVPVMGGTANAALPLPIECTAAGSVNFVDSVGLDSWTVGGTGSCQGNLQGTYILNFTGTGTSDSTGLCDNSVVVIDLKINVVGTLTDTAGSNSFPINHDWVAPATTYPLATPFEIQKNSDSSLIGAGNFFNHIFLQCGGSPTAQFTFSFFK